MKMMNVNTIKTMMLALLNALGIAVLHFVIYCTIDMLFFTRATMEQTIMSPISLGFGMMFFAFAFITACRRRGFFLKARG